MKKIPDDIKKVFRPLSKRIVEFETILNPQPTFDCTVFIESIDYAIDYFTVEEVVYNATLIYERIQPLLLGKYNKEDLSELHFYSESLNRILKPRRAMLNQLKTNEQSSPLSSQTIQLPEGYTVKQLTKHFEPSLTPSQAALLLHYFKEKGILPPYSDTSLGKLAEHFFARNQKNVTTNLTNIHSLKASKNELESLKKVLSSLIKEIDDDIKKAR